MMDARTREALEASIKHWQGNVAAEHPENASLNARDCALCEAFNSDDAEEEEDSCSGCPVAERVGSVLCESTPYRKAVPAFARWRSGVGSHEEFRAAAQDELDFLISLRPSEGGAA